MNNKLSKNIPCTQISVGNRKKSHLPSINTNPKWEICVNAKAEASIKVARQFPIDLAKLECTIPLKNNSLIVAQSLI
nr:hypothetical protein [Aquiflexum balticum]